MKRKNTNLGTTVSANFNEDMIIYDLMVNLLKKSYPVVKIKEKNRFKRGVIIDGKQFLVPKDNNMVFFSLFSILSEKGSLLRGFRPMPITFFGDAWSRRYIAAWIPNDPPPPNIA